jgi:hypothetical protein
VERGDGVVRARARLRSIPVFNDIGGVAHCAMVGSGTCLVLAVADTSDRHCAALKCARLIKACERNELSRTSYLRCLFLRTIRSTMSALETARPLYAPTAALPMVSVEWVANCPFSLALENAKLIFSSVEGPGLGVRIPFRSLGIPIDGGFKHYVTVRFHPEPDATDWGRLHDEIDFAWDARSRWLPNFNGVLRMRIEGLRTRVLLQGDYLPPLGRIGALLDRLVGRRLARLTAAELIDRLARALEARWATESENA